MVKSILILGVAMILWNCQKDGKTSSKRLKSVSLYSKNQSSRSKETDSIMYDNNNRMIECRRMFYDTLLNPNGFVTSIRYNETKYVFSYSAADNLPSSYLIISNSGNTYEQVLTYNDLKQPIIDSSLQQLNSVYLSYSQNVIVAKNTTIAGASGTRIDSFILQNDNIASHYSIFPSNTASNSVNQINYSTFPNPLHNFKGIGAVLYVQFQRNFDWISKNLFTNISNSRSLGNISMNWTTDGKGNVTSGSGFAIGSGATIRMTYTYY